MSDKIINAFTISEYLSSLWAGEDLKSNQKEKAILHIEKANLGLH